MTAVNGATSVDTTAGTGATVTPTDNVPVLN